MRKSLVTRLLSVLGLCAMLVPVMAETAAAQDASLCEAANGAPAGTRIDGYTVAYGSGGSGSQVVLGYGDAYLSGGSGHDVICAWGGNNTLDGGSGHDVLIVMDGTGNTLIGASGNDTMIGFASDTFIEGSGHDTVEKMPVTYTATVYLTLQGCNGLAVGAIVDGVEMSRLVEKDATCGFAQYGPLTFPYTTSLQFYLYDQTCGMIFYDDGNHARITPTDTGYQLGINDAYIDCSLGGELIPPIGEGNLRADVVITP